MKKLASIVLLTLVTTGLVCGEAYFDTVYEAMVDARETLKEVAAAVNKGLKTVAQTAKFVESFIDSTVEEECVFQCPKKKIPVRNSKHVPQADGCGSLGVFFEKDDLSRPEMVDCCNNHDICYDTCGSDKEDCDKKFKRCLYNTCEVDKREGDILGDKKCKGGAKLLYTATMALGCTSFKEAQRSACLCIDTEDVPEAKDEL